MVTRLRRCHPQVDSDPEQDTYTCSDLTDVPYRVLTGYEPALPAPLKISQFLFNAPFRKIFLLFLPFPPLPLLAGSYHYP